MVGVLEGRAHGGLQLLGSAITHRNEQLSCREPHPSGFSPCMHITDAKRITL